MTGNTERKKIDTYIMSDGAKCCIVEYTLEGERESGGGCSFTYSVHFIEEGSEIARNCDICGSGFQVEVEKA